MLIPLDSRKMQNGYNKSVYLKSKCIKIVKLYKNVAVARRYRSTSELLINTIAFDTISISFT